MNRVEALAKEQHAVAMTKTTGPKWEDEVQMVRSDWEEYARAALSHLGFDPEHPPEEGAARKMLEALKRCRDLTSEAGALNDAFAYARCCDLVLETVRDAIRAVGGDR